MSEGAKRQKLQSDARHFQDDDALDDEEVGEVPKCRGCRQCECASCIPQKQHLRQEEEDDDANLRPEHPLCDDCGECAGCRGDTPQASQVVQHTTDATNLRHNLPESAHLACPQDCAAQECRICNRTENIRTCALCTKGFCDNNHACVIGHWKLCDGGRRKAKDDQDEADGCEATQEYLHQRWKEEMGSNLLLCHERPGVPLNESAASEQKMMQMETPQGHGFVQSVIAHLGQLEAERYRVMLGFETETVEDIKYDPDSWLITYLRGELKEKISELKELGRKR